jgi:two-component system CheB/CheR fusion protein
MRPARARLEYKKKGRPLVPVVGIGASAGGLDAFTSLLKALPEDTGMSFVLISHLMHEQKSMLGELLSKATTMPVDQLERQTVIKPNHVYVIPPDKELSIENGRLKIAPLKPVDRPSMVIDRFFRSLASARKSKAVGVILSGTGTDGTLGLAEIKAEGGITFVQNEKSAAYSDMPRSAQSSADYILPPLLIAQELKRIASHPYVSREPISVEEAPDSSDILLQIFNLIKAAGGVNFGHYKQASIRRRIARRMVLKKIDSFASYLGHLRADKQEVAALYQDLLITVTEFFRDPGTFDVLKTRIIPQIFKRLPGDATARVWVPGCASGEEAYSIAMCFAETAARDRAVPPVQIFATDVSDQCIAKSRSALYPDSIAANVFPDRLRRFFVKEAAGYRVSKFIRDLCIFAEQDVVGDAPFSRMDLVSCRNLLIYLDTPTQKEVLHRFHYALKPTGFLLLGASESTAAAHELFEEVDKRERIYTKLPTATRIDFALAGHSSGHRALEKPVITPFRPSLDLGREIDQFLLRKFAPSGVLLNSAMDILEFRGTTSSVIEPEAGGASLNIFKMVRTELVVPLRVALHEARLSPKPVVKRGLVMRGGDQAKQIDLEVMRIRPEERGPTYYLVLFEDPNKATAKPTMPRTETSKVRVQEQGREANLEKELKSTQDHLKSIVEEQAKTNEELQSANEEVLASNEELQSMNEEMQTAKEELQATNEELHSVNDELQKRNADLEK